ncbi:MAG: DUF7483 domain-containing protein [Fluviibacter sp.]
MTIERALMGTTDSTGSANYIEDVFSTWLYTGNGTSQTINNGIDLSTKGGLVWLKDRLANPAWIMDTLRGTSSTLQPSTTGAAGAISTAITAFNSNGFSIGTNGNSNTNGNTYASWTFRKQAKFFDVVTYTGTGAPRTIAHNLGSVPGMIIVKCTSAAANWRVYHRGMTSAAYTMQLNQTSSQSLQTSIWDSTAPTSTVFSVGADLTVNDTGQTFVAYLLAHDAGGFGSAGTDNVISCGSYTGNGSATGPVVTLGYEPQYLMIKNASGAGNWQLIDNMRGMPVGYADATLQANLSSAESSVDYVSPTATGFQVTSTSTEVNTSGSTYIYMAIRRGPMKVPTSGTSVFSPIASSAGGTKLTTGFPVDLQIFNYNRAATSNKGYFYDRLRGVSTTSVGSGNYIYSNSISEEINTGNSTLGFDNTGYIFPAGWASSNIWWNFQRAPGFFDVVCYTATGVSPRNINHNLGVVPELVIIKCRNFADNWAVGATSLGDGYIYFNSNTGFTSGGQRTLPTGNTATTFQVGNDSSVNGSYSGTTGTYVAYLFATCPGVSKVGSYTGNGSSQTINCGFAAGARFVLIKSTNTTGDWIVYDSARGIVAAGDPSLALNTISAETTSDGIDPDSSGFIVNADPYVATKNPNVTSATYIYLAIA